MTETGRAGRGWSIATVGRLAVTVLLAASALTSVPAYAGSGATCTLTTTPLAFGKYRPSANTPADLTATISMTCTAPGKAAIPIHGIITLAGPTGRQLTNWAHQLRYQLYTDPARTVPLGTGGGGANGGAITVSGAVSPAWPFCAVYTVYGRVLARQSSVKVGQYADQVTVILNY